MRINGKTGKKYYGFYRGWVVQLRKEGRIKVFIPGVFPEEYAKDVKKLPLCELALPLICGGSSLNGSFGYPDVGSNVWCFFNNGDYNYPVAFASCTGDLTTYLRFDQSFTSDESKETCFDKDADGTEVGANQFQMNYGLSNISMNKGGGLMLQLQFPNSKKEQNCSIKMDANGTLRIEAGIKGIDIKSVGRINIHSNDAVNIKSGSDMLLATNSLMYIQGQEGVQNSAPNGNVTQTQKDNKIGGGEK